MDADSHPPRELFAEVADTIATGKFLFGGCTVRLDEEHLLLSLIVKTWNWASRIWKYAAGSFIFCETAAFRKIGGFNVELFASEEIDLSQRLKKLARASGRRGIILHRHPLVTSARKVHLYSVKEHLLFLTRTMLGLGRTLKSRDACHTWYDGRR